MKNNLNDVYKFGKLDIDMHFIQYVSTGLPIYRSDCTLQVKYHTRGVIFLLEKLFRPTLLDGEI